MKIRATIEFEVPPYDKTNVYGLLDLLNAWSFPPDRPQKVTKTFAKEVLTTCLTDEYNGICEKLKIQSLTITK